MEWVSEPRAMIGPDSAARQLPPVLSSMVYSSWRCSAQLSHVTHSHFTHSLTGSFLRAEMLDAARLHNNALLARGRKCSPKLHRATKGRPPAFRSESEPPSAHACTRLVFVTHGHMPASDISYPWGRILLIVYLSIVEQLHDHSSTYWSCSHSQLSYLLSHCTTTTPGQ